MAGYALRKHIGKSLSTRSPAIRTALEHYNTAAKALSPPRRTLEWKDVVEYTFLADFDLLRDTRQDISQRPWATPAGRLAMDTYFKMCRAREEIERLNVEIRRVATYLRDEDRFLSDCEVQVRDFDPALAHQIYLHRMERGRFNILHARRLIEISRLGGFTGSISPGIAVDTGKGASASRPNIQRPDMGIDQELAGAQHQHQPQVEEEEEDEEDEDDLEGGEEDDLSQAIHDIMYISARS